MLGNRIDLKLLRSICLIVALEGLLECCNPTVGPSSPSIRLSAVDIGSTMVWLHITISADVPGRTISLTRDGLPLRTVTVGVSDTVLFDDSLLANHRYSYSACSPT